MLPTTFRLNNRDNVVIRKAQKGDEYDYAAVSRACYLETRYLSRGLNDILPSPEALLVFIEDVAFSDKETLLLAVHNNTIVGFGDITACLNREKMKHKCDLNISVLKEYWHLGIGRALMSSLIEFAQQADYEQINLNVASDNIRAIRLYEHFGFQATGREVHALRHADGDYSDFVFMTKFLK